MERAVGSVATAASDGTVGGAAINVVTEDLADAREKLAAGRHNTVVPAPSAASMHFWQRS